jgi:hypothetical protein
VDFYAETGCLVGDPGAHRTCSDDCDSFNFQDFSPELILLLSKSEEDGV